MRIVTTSVGRKVRWVTCGVLATQIHACRDERIVEPRLHRGRVRDANLVEGWLVVEDRAAGKVAGRRIGGAWRRQDDAMRARPVRVLYRAGA